MKKYEGIILKGIGGFYYVEAADALVECKARGIFRKDGITPLAGDHVVISAENYKGIILEIGKRKNHLIRPPVANLDKLIIVSSVDSPSPNLLLIDKLCVLAINNDIQPIVVISKADIADTSKLIETYKKSDIVSFSVSIITMEGIDLLKSQLKGCLSAFAGNSGVGKSSIMNILDNKLDLPTDQISSKLGRGKHTTRQVELYKFAGGYVADTPGFSSLVFDDKNIIQKNSLQFCFPEFKEYLDKCKFSGCSHVKETGCSIINAVQNDKIAISRYNSYIAMYNEAKNQNDWDK